MGIVNSDVTLPQEIRTIPHKAWQIHRFAILKVFVSTVTEMLQECLRCRTFEPCHGFYRNNWFVMRKKEKRMYRLINAALDMNKVTIQDANLPLSVDEFSDDFADCAICFLIDFFFKYDQIDLAI